jgi:hypothetical protein
VKGRVNEPSRNKDNGDWKKKMGQWGRITTYGAFERTPREIRAQSRVSDRRRRQSAHNDDGEMRRGRKTVIAKEWKETYSIQLSARKLINLVDVHGETVDDGAGYGFDTRLDHFCAILTEEDYVILRR